LAEWANDADRKARLREAAKQWLDLAEQVEQLDAAKTAAEPPPASQLAHSRAGSGSAHWDSVKPDFWQNLSVLSMCPH
jgi:hypothetical protein